MPNREVHVSGDSHPRYVLGPDRASLTLVAMVVFVGLWLILMPHLGPPDSHTSGLTAEIVPRGGRALCPPPAFILLTDPHHVSERYDKQKCMEVGRVRWHYGWMLLFAAGVGVATNIVYRRRTSDRGGNHAG